MAETTSSTATTGNPGPPALQSDRFLSEAEEQTLLRLARTTLAEWVERQSKSVDLTKFELTPILRRKSGAFVTLHAQGDLRGCIGYIEGIKPLYETVMDNARNAATEDTRFSPVGKAELAQIDIEISALSPLRKIGSVEEIVIGKHGLLIKKGYNQGVFLPQVPVEQGWNLEQYLEGICRKAYLPRGAWKEGAELQVFTAQVFGEKESRAGGKTK
jgi:AmmeMemoRadiSam system protein A